MTWIDLEGVMLNERTQTKDKDYILSLICGYRNITKKRIRITDIENSVVTKGGKEQDGDRGIKYKLLYVK